MQVGRWEGGVKDCVGVEAVGDAKMADLADLEEGDVPRVVLARDVSDLEVFVAPDGVVEGFPEPHTAARALRWESTQPSEEVAGLHVTVVGDRSKPALVTFHDVGTNAHACFRKFLAYCAYEHPVDCPQLFHTCQYHVEAPGHHQLSQQIAPDAAWLSLEEIAERVAEVIAHYKLRSVLGFGVGAGAEVLIRLALAHRDKVRSLFLESPSISAASYYERWCFQLGAGYQWLGQPSVPADAKRLLLTRWFSDERVAMGQYDNRLASDLESMQSDNIMRFVYANAMRTDISERLAELRGLKIVLVIGKDAWMYDEAINAVSKFDPESITVVEVPHTGALPHIDEPDTLARALKLYLQGHSIVS